MVVVVVVVVSVVVVIVVVVVVVVVIVLVAVVVVVIVILIQWNPLEVNTLEVNSRLKSTPHGGPDFFLLCLSNFIPLKVNILGPILG